ncbi:MAG: M23 family metallopeptidase [Candidatus Gracilibacteria bacterium]
MMISVYTPSNAYSDGSSAASAADIGEIWQSSQVDSTLMTDQEGYLTKVNPQTSIGDRSTMNDYLVHTIASGETASTIATSYQLHTSTVLWANNISDRSTLQVGQKLFIPPVDGVSHKIAKADNLQKIAKAYGVSADAISKQNGLTNGTLIYGEDLIIPGGKPLPVDTAPDLSKVKIKNTTVGRDTPARVTTASRVNAVAAVPTAGGAILGGTSAVPIGNKPFIFPTHGQITQGFRSGHYAFDIANTDRPAIWSAGAGTVVKVVSGCADVSYSCGGGYGNHVIIDHGNGLQTLYGHMTYTSVQVGDRIDQGQVVGKMGRSGRVRGVTGIHLHFEVRKNGVKQVPSNFY